MKLIEIVYCKKSVIWMKTKREAEIHAQARDSDDMWHTFASSLPRVYCSLVSFSLIVVLNLMKLKMQK